MPISKAQFALDRLEGVLKDRKAELDRWLSQTNDAGARDFLGRAPFVYRGEERQRLEEEARRVADWLQIIDLKEPK